MTRSTKRWPKSRQQKQREQERAQQQLEATLAQLPDDALELFEALTVADAWDNPLYVPLVDRVEAELRAAELKASTLPENTKPRRHPRFRPRLPSKIASDVSPTEQDQALRVLNNALGIEESEPKRTAAKLMQKLRRRKKAAEPTQKPRPLRRSRRRTQSVPTAESQQEPSETLPPEPHWQTVFDGTKGSGLGFRTAEEKWRGT